MALTQMQLIQSLGEAMAWFERELNWGVQATEARHLCGRIGELYAAMITNGQMASEVNQKGYDVVAANGEKISVKTTAMQGINGHVSFNLKSLCYVDRVMVLRINTEEMQVETLLDSSLTDAMKLMAEEKAGRRVLPLSRLVKKRKPRAPLKTLKVVSYEGYTVRELENGSIEVEQGGKVRIPAKPVLRQLATLLNIGLLNSHGNPLNTRALGTQIIRNILELSSSK